jgi:opacity protein-like surface antigen
LPALAWKPDRRSHRFGLSGPDTAGHDRRQQTKLVYGYSVGAGIDVMLVGGLFVRAEYEYRRVTSDIESNINTVRAGLGYKF